MPAEPSRILRPKDDAPRRFVGARHGGGRGVRILSNTIDFPDQPGPVRGLSAVNP